MPDLAGGFRSLGANINKVLPSAKEERKEGIVSELMPTLSFELDNKELSKLTDDWEKTWLNFEVGLEKKRKTNEEYWLGNQFGSTQALEERSLVDNVVYESLETFLPVATRQNPESSVSSDNSPLSREFAKQIQDLLVRWSNDIRFKLKIKRMTRNWALYYLGALKLSWSIKEDNISLVVIRPQKLILDPTATIEDGGIYTGAYLGERKTDTAEDLIALFPEKKEFISNQVKDKLGTKLQYTEWWTDDFLFWTLNKEVLGKEENPHWNEATTSVTTDSSGVETETEVEGMNHFQERQMPYVFLSVFNLGRHPVDDTGLIEQILSEQDLINKRLRQIDKNVDNQNAGMTVSGDAFTKEQAQGVQRALRNGGVVWVPQGAPKDSVDRFNAQALPSDVFNQLQDQRNRALQIFGTAGLSSAGIAGEETVRGKIIVRGSDSSRIGGGITEFIEQVSDRVYNYVTQMIYVYYDEKNVARVLGEEEAAIFEQNRDNFKGKLNVDVKEGSLIPKDDLTRRNEAIELWGANAIDPLTLNERLEDPNPEEAVKRLIQWNTNPGSLIEDTVTPQEQQQIPQAPQPEPSVETQLLNQVPLQ